MELDSPKLSAGSRRDFEMSNRHRSEKNAFGENVVTKKATPFAWGRLGANILDKPKTHTCGARPGERILGIPNGVFNVKVSEYPETALDSTDYAKRLRFEELKKTKLEEMCSWK